MLTAKLSDGQTFQTDESVSLLDAALKSGVLLPYSCRTGRCNSCKARVINGTTFAVRDEAGLSSDELSNGWILTCARKAQSDIELEAESLKSLSIPVPKTLPCRISHIERLAPDVIKVLLRFPPTTEFEFIPGQYIDVIGPSGIRRSYSLANANFSQKVIELHIRVVENGVMSYFWSNVANINDLLRINGPLGTFILRDTANVDLYFLATGTGIAPIKSMLESLQDLPSEQQPKSVTVLWGGRGSKDLYIDLPTFKGDYKYIAVQSRPDEGWTGVKGYIQDVLVDLKPCFENAAVYACGSEAMIKDAKKRLIDLGLPDRRFYADAFVSSGTN